jgi:hypothetical protein
MKFKSLCEALSSEVIASRASDRTVIESAEGKALAVVEVRDPFLNDMPDLVATCVCGLE